MSTIDHCTALVRDRDRDRYLATLYAPPALRAALFALHALDIELAEVARSTTEPMLGQIRLAWWREQLQGLDAGARPAQPVLTAIAEAVLPAGISGASLEPFEDAWLATLDDDIAAHAEARARLFEAVLGLLATQPSASATKAVRRLGAGWAIVDIARTGRAVDEALLTRAAELLAPAKLPSSARLLSGLGALARRDLVQLRAGRMPGLRGTPGRQARLAWSIFTGK